MGVAVLIVHLCPKCLKTWKEPERDDAGKALEPKSRTYHCLCDPCEKPPVAGEFLDPIPTTSGDDDGAPASTAIPPWKR